MDDDKRPEGVEVYGAVTDKRSMRKSMTIVMMSIHKILLLLLIKIIVIIIRLHLTWTTGGYRPS